MSQQLTLGVQLRDDASFSNFFIGDNAALINTLRQCVAADNTSAIYLWGKSGVGRSHLLQACCHAFAEYHVPMMYLPLTKNDAMSPDILQGLAHLKLLCLDDIDQVLGDPCWEEALMNVYNRAIDCGCRLIVSANVSPAQLNCRLADLQSRLAAMLIFQVHKLDDEQQSQALQMRASNRGLVLSDEAVQFILRHYPRDMATLVALLNVLDQASLSQQRRLTIPFIKTVLN